MIPRGLRRSFAALGLALGAEHLALAENARQFSLDWSAPAGCPDRSAVRVEVERLLGTPAEGRVHDALAVRGVVTEDAQGAALELHTVEDGVPGARAIRGSSCTEVSNAGALVIALAVDPEAVREHSQNLATAAFSAPATLTSASPATPAAPPVTPVALSALPAQPALPPRAAPEPRRASAPLTSGHVAGRALLDVGTLSKATLGVGAESGFSTGRYRVSLAVNYFLPRFAGAPLEFAGAGRGAEVSLFVGDVAACDAVVEGAVRLEACLGVEAGALIAAGKAFDRPSTAVEPWLAGLGSLGFGLPRVEPLLVHADVGLAVPFGRSEIRFRDDSGTFRDLDRPGPVSGRFGVAVGLAFR